MIAARWKAMPWVLGVCLLAFSFVAANRLLHTQEGNNGAGPEAPKKDGKAAPSGEAKAQGLTVLGTVDAPQGVGRVDAPSFPALSGATVIAVYVVPGQEVKVGDPLLKFDDSLFLAKLDQAEAALNAAKGDAEKAKVQKETLAIGIELQKIAIKKAEKDLHFTKEAYKRARDAFELLLAADKMRSDLEKENARYNNLELLKGEQLIASATFAVEKEQKELAVLQSKPVDVDVQLAAAKIANATAAVAEAKAVIELATVKARSAGVVERLIAHPGRTFGPATREPALYIVPGGVRIVRAEVEAEFAHKVHDKVGRKVTICDSHNFNQTYEGRVTRIATSYFPNRGSGDMLAVNPSQVLECEIEVLDPTPAGKPPLRMGQKVRVAFGP